MLRKHIRNLAYAIYQNPLAKHQYNQEIKRRSRLKFTDIKLLSKEINLFSPFTNEVHKPNDWYGHATILKKFLRYPKSYRFNSVIEHGFYLNDQIATIEKEAPLQSFITYSKHRKANLEKHGIKAFAIGPFINYANSYFSKTRLKKEKGKIGKCLLVFPFHSNPDLNFEYDLDGFCKNIKSFSNDYDTVRVNLYWTDILKGQNKRYEKYGFECVTAGHVLDPYFLPRLKSIISLSDYTISNHVSTPLGYCIFMGKPHYIIDQRPKLKGDFKESNLFKDYIVSKDYDDVLKEFIKPVKNISNKQKQVVKKYWGTDQIKTKKELVKIIKETEYL